MDPSNSLLDTLMLQVEAESGPSHQIPPSSSKRPTETTAAENVVGQEQGEAADGINNKDDVASHDALQSPNDGTMDVEPTSDVVVALAEIQTTVNEDVAKTQVKQETSKPTGDVISQDRSNTRIQSTDTAETQSAISTESSSAADTTLADEIVNPIPTTATTETIELGAVEVPEAAPVEDVLVTETMIDVGETQTSDTASSTLNVDAIPSDPTLAPQTGAEGAEWEVDSSPYESSDTDSSSDTTSSDDDSDDDADGDYAMLDPEEAARILMQGDGGSDDEGGRSKDKSDGATLRTANERFEEVIPKPDITITEDMKIEELGNVEFVVESTVVIKAKTSGEYQVLETGSLICLSDRTVLGVVADLIGRVEEPRYTIRFTNDEEIEKAGVSSVGTTVFYVPQHSTFVFTQPLKGVKGSDASNFHDEEVGDDEMEFSDDEAEAEHKRQLKLKRQGRALESGRARGGSKFSRGGHRGGRGGYHGLPTISDSRELENPEMNYDDLPDAGDDGYTPLQRPDHLSEMIATGVQPMTHPLPPAPSTQTGRGDFAGRGRGYGRGGRGGNRGHRGRGGFSQSGPSHWNNPSNNNKSYQSNTNGYAQQNGSTNSAPRVNLPSTPSITPHNVTYPPMSPSPITPLPNSSFNFGGFHQPPPPSFGFPPPPPGFNFPQPPIPGLAPPPPMPSFQQQYNQPPRGHQAHHQNQRSNPSVPGLPGLQAGSWANNPAFGAEFQRQVEEQQRRSQGQNKN